MFIISDPHFKMWSGRRYDFQWECDMIHVRNSLLDLHIRTEYRGVWSAVSETALRFVTDILEVQQDGTVLVNGAPTASTSFLLDGTYMVVVGPFTGPGKRVVTVALAGGQYIEFTTTDFHINMYIDANGGDFCDSEGMSGNWQIDGFIGRDGMTPVTFGPLSAGYNKVEYGIEWEVDATLGDPILFSTPTTKSCADQPECEPLPENPDVVVLCDRDNKEPDDEALQMAEDICMGLVTNMDDLENCAFDVAIEGVEWVKQNTPYADVYEPTERCLPAILEEVPDDREPRDEPLPGPVRPGTKTCADLGGRCVFRCDPDISDCIEGIDLCVPQLTVIGDRRSLRHQEEEDEDEDERPDFVEGCSCAVPKEISKTPTEIPSGAPTDSPCTDSPYSFTIVKYPEYGAVTCPQVRRKLQSYPFSTGTRACGFLVEGGGTIADYCPNLCAEYETGPCV